MPAILGIVAVVIVGALVVVFMNGSSESAVTTVTAVDEVRVEDVVTENDEVTVMTDDEDDEIETVTATEATETLADPVVTEPDPDPEPEPVAASDYDNGTYTAEVEYRVPGNRTEGMSVTLTLNNDVVTAAEVSFEGDIGTSRLYQGRFNAAYETEVIGVDLDTLSLSRVGGASLSSGGFNDAVAEIKNQAS
ncbi:MAG: hypothetical protein AAFO91_07755 [Bacteroidota bacterium]